ncbi:hypothetical protein [Brevibacillus reuszeri]|uniref:hypothetical protein n=1 Tax=Brevibacillus reuszeri TaxID=54915 RepID=UPI000CCC7B1E|nr:hypothetical protein [Brevibacillus reuszeri]
MYNFQVGSMVINGQLVLFASFYLAGWMMLHYRLRGSQDKKLILSVAANAFLLWLLIWKASYFLLHPQEIISHPISLLYFDGGERGQWTASLVAIAYSGYACRKRSLPVRLWVDSGMWFWFAGWMVYHVLLLVMGEAPAVYAFLLAGLCLTSWVWYWEKRQEGEAHG